VGFLAGEATQGELQGEYRWKMNSWLQVCLCLHIDALEFHIVIIFLQKLCPSPLSTPFIMQNYDHNVRETP